MPNALARAGAFPEEWEPNQVPPPTVALEQKLDIYPSGSSRIATGRCDAGNGCRVAYTLDTASIDRARTKLVLHSCCHPAASATRIDYEIAGVVAC